MDLGCKMAPVFGCASASVYVFVYFTYCASIFGTVLPGVISLLIYDASDKICYG